MENFDDENNVHEKLPKNKVTHTISILKFIIYTNKMIYYVFKVGDGTLPGTTQGPIINSKQLSRVERIVKESLSQGATCQLGGSTSGNCFLPTILTDVKGTTVYICQII